MNGCRGSEGRSQSTQAARQSIRGQMIPYGPNADELLYLVQSKIAITCG